MPLSLRKSGLIFLLVISVLSVHAQCTTPINTFPYVEDFETSASWTTGGPACTPSNVVINDWTWGTPSKNVINSAGSGLKCWIAGGLTGWIYAYGDRGWVESPCFDFSAVQRPYIQFKIFWESEYKYDGAVLQYSTNNGSTWTNVGAYGDPTDCMDTNWYNYNSITNLETYTGVVAPYGSNTYQALSSNKQGWCGNIQASYADTTGVSTSTCQGGHGLGHWTTAKHCMPYLAGKPQVLFRFAFGAGTSCNNFNGFAFDSVAIGEGTPNAANFTYSCVNTNTLHFTGIAPLCPDTFQWNFGDPGSGASNTILGAGSLNPTHTFSAPGTYTVTFTVKGGPCNAPGTISKIINVIGLTTTTIPVLCPGGNDGSAIANVAGNAQPYTYAWSSTPAQSTDTASSLTAGTYTVTVTSGGACSATATAVITQPAAFNISAVVTPPTCHGDTNGYVTVNVTGGTTPYTYHWASTSSTSNIEPNLGAGGYIITVTDHNSCTTTIGGSVSEPPALTHTIATTATLCGASTGQAKVTESGGTPAYTYLWSNSLGTADSIQNMPAGSYTLSVTDSHGCVDTVPVSISNTGGVTATLGSVSNVTCPGGSNGSITINAANGTLPYTYHWGTVTNGNSTQGGFSAGNYVITVTDGAGCISTVAAAVNAPSAFTHTAILRPTTCGLNNGFAQVIESGGTPGYTYAWSNALGNTDSISNVAAGTYTLSVTDGSGCPDVIHVTVTAIPPVTASLGSVTAVSCFGGSDGSITINAGSGTTPYTYHWGSSTGTTNTQTGFIAGSYTITVTDSNGCSATVPATITQPNAITATPSVTNVTCNGGNNGTVSLTVSGGNGGNTYQWTNTTQTTQSISNLSANTYSVTVKDQKGCTFDTFGIVAQPSPLVITFTGILNDSCSYDSKGSATASASGSSPGYTYLWSNAATTNSITNLSPASYSVTVSDTNHCTATNSININAPSALLIHPSSTDVSCHNDSDGRAAVTVSGGTPGYTYFWSDDSTTSNISNLHPGNYTATITDSWGCTATSSTITVGNPSVLTVSASVNPQSCASQVDGSVSLTASGGTPTYSYAWSPTSGTNASITSLTAGSYFYTVTDSRGCTVSDSSVVPLSLAITLQATVIQPLCPPLATGSIAVTATGGNPGYTYMWSNAAQNPTNAQLAPGTYLLTVTDSRGCTALDTFTLAYQGSLTVNAGIADTIDLGQSATLTAITNSTAGDISYIWSPDYHLSCVDCQSNVAFPVQTITYTVVASDTNGCRATDSVTVYVNKNYNIYIPNAFTPNGNSVNDYFQIFGDTTSWKQVSADIYNRWGEKIFESHDIDFKWDGTYKGKLQEPNVYVYVINVTFIDGHSTGVLKGSVTLIR